MDGDTRSDTRPAVAPEAASLLDQFKRSAAAKLRQDLAQVLRCARLLTLNELWHRSNDHCNSVGSLLLHLTGNVRQWILAGIGGESFERDRPAEFGQRVALPAEPILAELERVACAAIDMIEQLDPAGLARRCSIQGYDVSALQAVFHVAEHFSFHTGQIVHMTKVLRSVDLSLYDAQGRRLAAGSEPW